MNDDAVAFAGLTAAARAAGGLFIGLDRDGTLIEDRGYGVTPSQVALQPGVASLFRSLRSPGYPVKTAIFTNQSAIGRGLTDWETVTAVNAEVVRLVNATVEATWLRLEDFFVCPHTPTDGCSCRKPMPGMFEAATAMFGTGSWPFLMIGDRESDVEFGTRCGGMSVRLGAESTHAAAAGPNNESLVPGLLEVASLLGHRV